MCGIAGIFSPGGKPVFEHEVRDMCSAIVHRGPDDEGVYLAAGVGLGMRRLSIIDLASGHQPVSNEDGTVWVVLNGEIYNFQEVRQSLQRKGHVFSTSTDTEVIVHLYEEYGPACVEHMRGMFAFALWDTRAKKLLVARDRVGIKPLYYAEVDGRVLFASEVKCFLQLPEFEKRISWSAVAHLFSYLTTPPDEGILEGVRKLEPGHLMIAGPGQEPKIYRYWDLKFQPDHGRDENYFIDRTRELLDESVRLHMIADVPLGSFLSGGIDSSTVVAIASKLTSQPLKTFTIGFTEPAYNELEHARAVAAAFNTEFHSLTLGPDTLQSLDDLAWNLDEPFGDSSAIPTYMVSKLAAESVKVVLSGDGGDELFAGYDKYVIEGRERGSLFTSAPLRGAMGRISRALPAGTRGKNFLRHRALSGTLRYLDASTLFRRSELMRLFRPEFAQQLALSAHVERKASELETRDRHWLSNLQALDMKNYLPLDILTKVDRMSMAHSIEARVPLLDHKLIEFAATIPPEMNLRGGATKYILKQAMRGVLPDNIIDRRKQGFALPLNFWFRGKLGPYVHDLLLGESSRQRGFFNLPYVESLIARHEKGENLDLQLWTLISFELWAQTFLGNSVKARGKAA
jgi:asparagine synthase (glutamine-hydrolysing)